MDIDALIGQIQLFAFGYAPSGWMQCQGQTMQITQNTALYSLIGTAYGGDGRTTFCLPNLTGCEPNPNSRYYIAIQGLYPSRS